MSPSPYRTDSPTSSSGPEPSPRAPHQRGGARLALALGALALGLYGVRSLLRRSATPLEAPPELTDRGSRFPLSADTLEPSTPLAPLLASDEPERLAVLEPTGLALHLSRGESLRFRFNRLMVEGARVGVALERSPLRLQPSLPVTARWVTRSQLEVVPDASAWSVERTVRVALDPTLRSAGGETLGETPERTVAFDPRAHWLRHQTPSQLAAGAPLPLYFDGPVEPAAVSSRLLVFERQGAQRVFPAQLVAVGNEGQSNYRLDLHLPALEPGTQLEVLGTPSLVGYNPYDLPRVNVQLEFGPQWLGASCSPGASMVSQCRVQSMRPAAVVDFGDRFVLLANRALGTVDASAIQLRPAVPGLRVAPQGSTLALQGEWAPDQVYELRVASVTSADGALFPAPPPLAIRSRGHAPSLTMPSRLLTWEASATPAMPLSGVNVARGTFLVSPVPVGRELEALRSWQSTFAAPSIAGPRALSSLLPDARPNRSARASVDWRLLGAEGSNLAMLTARSIGAPGEGESAGEVRALVQQTDLGLTARATRTGVLVWVTSLRRAAPLEGVELELAYNNERRTARTGADGAAWLALPLADAQGANLYLRAALGSDRAVLALDTRTAVGPSQLGLFAGEEERAAAEVTATLFADRGIYRPGETVRAQALVRALRGDRLVVPHTQGLRLQLFSPEQSTPVATHPVRLSPAGTVDGAFPLPEFATQGPWRVELWHQGDTTPLGVLSVRVARYRQPTLRAELSGLESSVLGGATLHADAEVRYLFGAPLANAALRWTVTREAASEHGERWADFAFAPMDGPTRFGTMTSTEGTLDAQGHARLETPVDLVSPQRTRLSIEVEATDPGGESITARRTVLAYPASYEVGLRRPSGWQERGQPLQLQGIALDPRGLPVEGRALRFTVRRSSQRGYWEWVDQGDEDSGTWAQRRASSSEPVFHCEAQSAREPAGCAFTPTQQGEYLLEVSSTDDAGHTAFASASVYIAGDERRADRDPPGSSIAVTPARRRVEVGDRARVAFENPFPEAEALLTVEREGVLYRERRHVQRGSVVWELPVSAEFVPNAFVHVTLVRPRTADAASGPDLEAPDLRLGATELEVRPRRAPLLVQLTLPQAPQAAGSTLEVEAQVRDVEGHPVAGELTLFAVDEGTLRLTSYRTPSPLEGLFRRRSAASYIEDLRRSLATRLTEVSSMLAGGDGDADEAGTGANSEDDGADGEHADPTAFWLPRLRADREGRVHARVQLPLRATQYRVMAVAVDTQGHLGSAEGPLTATRAVILRPSLPRTLTEGDRFEAAWTLHNDTDLARTFTPALTVNGATRNLDSVSVPARGSVPVRVPLETQGMRSLRLALDVRGEAGSNHHEATLTVQPRGRWTNSQLTGAFSAERRELTVQLAGAVHDTATLRLSVGSHPFLGFEMALEEADASSSLLLTRVLQLQTRLSLAQLRRLAGAPTSELAELRTRSERDLAQLAAWQTPSGTLGVWPGDGIADAETSLRLLDAASTARALGYALPASLLERGTAFARSVTEEQHLPLAYSALCAAGACEPARADALFALRERLSAYQLALVAAAMPASDRRRDTLALKALNRVLNPPTTRGASPGLPEVSTLAALLRAATVVEAARPQARRAASLLLRQRNAGRGSQWDSLQGTADALLGLAPYAALFAERPTGELQVSFDGRPLSAAARNTSVQSFALPSNAGDGESHRLAVRCAAGPCFFSLTGRWAEALTEDDQVARGHLLALHRVLENEQGRALAEGEPVTLGERLRVRLFVYSEEQLNSALELRSPVGGGFDALDTAFETGPRAALTALLGQGPDDGDTIDPRGYRARRSQDFISVLRSGSSTVTFGLTQLGTGLSEFTYGVRASAAGTFTLPPATLSMPSNPAARARSAVQTLTVLRSR